ncbi:BnaC02g34360D [Brassica napus]|uniref:BnaC02g34360D protein n=1 Tax=Brassica napus TaxID=3708 RepID=A0A078FSJ0_BRANA|nr:BnaC02g34360D [Brassica napus]
MGISEMGGVRWDLRISERDTGGVEAKGGKRWGERGEEGSGGSRGNGGGRRASPEVEDDSCMAETRSGRAQRFCIGKWVRESLT